MNSAPKWATYGVAGVLVAITLGLVIWFFEQLPIEGTMLGIDLYGSWLAFTGPRPVFGNSPGLHFAPWVAIPLLLLGRLSFRAAWGVVTLLLLTALLVSVPPTRHRWQRWLGMALLCTAYPALRTIADGNMEYLVIAGVLLVVRGYNTHNPLVLAAGLLLATAKVQETWLLMLMLGFWILRTWPRERWLRLGGWLLVVIVPSLAWLGGDWVRGMSEINTRGSLMNSSLMAGLGRLGWPGWLIAAVWVLGLGLALGAIWRLGPSLSRVKAGLLVAASLVLAPYASGNSFLTVLAMGVMPLVLVGDALGIGLLILTNLPFLAPAELSVNYSGYYWTVLWTVAAVGFAYRESRRAAPATALPAGG